MNREIISSCFLNRQSYNATADPLFRWAFCTEYPFVEKQKTGDVWEVALLGRDVSRYLVALCEERAASSLARLPCPHLSSLFCVRSKKSQSPHENNFIFQWNLFQNYWNSILLLIYKYSYKNNLSLFSLVKGLDIKTAHSSKSDGLLRYCRLGQVLPGPLERN